MKKKFYKRPVFWVIAVILIIAISATNSNSEKNSADSKPATSISEVGPVAVQQQSAAEPVATTAQVKPTETVSQKNAIKKAKSYLDFTGFSHDGLVSQLEYDKFSNVDAVYGADNSGADWNVQATIKAKSYMEFSSFSRDGLISQLQYDKFTAEQSAHGADSVGL